MRTSRLLPILSGLALLAVMIFYSVRYGRSAAPAVSIQLVGVTNDNTVVQFRVLNPRGLFTFLEEVRVEETNDSTLPELDMKIGVASYSANQNRILSIRLSRPLSADKTYRVVAFYRYRGVFEQILCSGVERVPILVRFLPSSRKVVATSECFVAKPEVSQTNPE